MLQTSFYNLEKKPIDQGILIFISRSYKIVIITEHGDVEQRFLESATQRNDTLQEDFDLPDYSTTIYLDSPQFLCRY